MSSEAKKATKEIRSLVMCESAENYGVVNVCLEFPNEKVEVVLDQISAEAKAKVIEILTGDLSYCTRESGHHHEYRRGYNAHIFDIQQMLKAINEGELTKQTYLVDVLEDAKAALLAKIDRSKGKLSAGSVSFIMNAIIKEVKQEEK